MSVLRWGCLLAGVVAVFGCAASRDLRGAASDGSTSPLETDVDRERVGDASAASMAVGPQGGWPDGGYDLVSVRGCVRDPIAPGFSFSPTLICEGSTVVPGQLACSRARAIECVRASDCTAQPFGRCEAGTSSQCSYPHAGSSCSVDADCDELPQGVCVPPLAAGPLCDAAGENCRLDAARCHYLPLNQVCTRDEECVAAEGGACTRAVRLTRCIYLDCEDTVDCADGERCACGSCVKAECHDDLDCGLGQRCLRGNPCGFGADGDFFCSKPEDECGSDDDCLDAFCDYDRDAARFVCSTGRCTVP